MRLSKISSKYSPLSQTGTPEGFRSERRLLNKSDENSPSRSNLNIAKEKIIESPILASRRRQSSIIGHHVVQERRRTDSVLNLKKTPRDTENGTVDNPTDRRSTPNDSYPQLPAVAEHGQHVMNITGLVIRSRKQWPKSLSTITGSQQRKARWSH